MALLPLESSYESQGESAFCEQTLTGLGASGRANASLLQRRGGSTKSRAKSASKYPASEQPAKSMSKNLMSELKDVLANWMDRYHQATCTKMYDVEELIDYYFHRRLAALIAVIISYLPIVITPNQITLFGLVLGWASALCLYDSEFHAPLGWQREESLAAAAALMFVWIVSDCADGQVARLCKRGTRTGRILDGVVDGLVLAPNCLVLGFISSNRWGESYFVLTVVAGLSLWLHALIYDKVKNVYMENSLPQSECDGETVESVRAEYLVAKAEAPYTLDSVLLGIYVIYLTLQAKCTSAAAAKAEAAQHSLLVKCNDAYHKMYMQKFNHIVRIASFMGISAHVVGLYVAYYVAIFYPIALLVVQLYFAVLLNAVLLTVLVMYSRSGMTTAAQRWGPTLQSK